MKTVILSLSFVFILSAVVAGELDKLFLEEIDLPKGVTFMQPSSVMRPEFLRRKNRAVFSDEATLKQFCAMFLRDDSFASNIAEVSLTGCRVPINEAHIIGHQLKDAGKIEELKKAYAFLTSKVRYHEFFESGNLVFVVWSDDDEAKELFDELASVVGEKLKAHKIGVQQDDGK